MCGIRLFSLVVSLALMLSGCGLLPPGNEKSCTGSGTEHPFPLDKTRPCQPAWSPDSRWIVFSSPQGLGVIDAEGMTMALLTQESSQYPAWYP